MYVKQTKKYRSCCKCGKILLRDEQKIYLFFPPRAICKECYEFRSYNHPVMWKVSETLRLLLGVAVFMSPLLILLLGCLWAIFISPINKKVVYVLAGTAIFLPGLLGKLFPERTPRSKKDNVNNNSERK